VQERTNVKEWCLGFIISEDDDSVVLLRKGQTMHVGMWNGLGGKLEDKESAHDAMVRECKEESGLTIKEWTLVGYLRGTVDGNPWRVFVYVAPSTERINEITADWANKASLDTPYKIRIDSLAYMSLAPHTELLVVAARNKLKDKNAPLVQIMEV
jgi:ADP-ribose pyrophosphatase YjhB (NUDIX family)